MSSTNKQYQYLAPNPKSFYRQLFIKGTRIRADVIYGQYVSEEEPKMSPEDIATEYNLPVEAVREAIAYCASDPPEIAQDDAREKALMDATGMSDPNYKYHGKPKLLSAEEMARIRRS
jgi:uncharacterized protein (DUF433 family)